MRTGASRRIIPARAGFTGPAGRRRRGGADHPRSRGVYWKFPRRRRHSGGSSPLARGLRAPLSFVDRLARIIPARAGFTHTRGREGDADQDHPRSRGVYNHLEPLPRWQGGSSPLARGLRFADAAGTHNHRIIPARAGFTPWGNPKWPRSRDHPRSRGVYGGAADLIFSPRGSSPLARGLPTYPEPIARHRRIIPARAGFTMT